MKQDYIEEYWERGYAIIRSLFSKSEMESIKAATDEVKQRCFDKGSSHRHGNIRCWVEEDPKIGLNVRGMQWPSYWSETLNAVRTDPRMLEILQPLIGVNVRQIINQLHWKTPGGSVAVRYHIDRHNRRPPECYRDLEHSYVQTGLAVDPQLVVNGVLKVIPGSHKQVTTVGSKKEFSNFTQTEVSTASVTAFGYKPEDLVCAECQPGDITLWHPDTIHGSEQNRHPTMDRCLYINGYVKAENCSRGAFSFIREQAIPLPPVEVPILIQAEDVFNDEPQTMTKARFSD